MGCLLKFNGNNPVVFNIVEVSIPSKHNKLLYYFINQL